MAQGIADNNTVAEYSIMIYYTQEFRNGTRAIKQFMSQLIAETNMGYQNSKIPLRAKLFCAEVAVGFPPEVPGPPILNYYIGVTDKILKQVLIKCHKLKK